MVRDRIAVVGVWTGEYQDSEVRCPGKEGEPNEVGVGRAEHCCICNRKGSNHATIERESVRDNTDLQRVECMLVGKR